MGHQENIKNAIFAYKSDRDFTKYLIQLNEDVENYLKEIGNDFLYFSIAYFEGNKLKSLPIRFKTDNNDESTKKKKEKDVKEKVDNILKNAFKLIENDISLSLSDCISKEKIFSLILANKNCDPTNENIINLENYNFINDANKDRYIKFCDYLDSENVDDTNDLFLNLIFFENSKTYENNTKYLGIYDIRNELVKGKYDAIIAIYKHMAEILNEQKDGKNETIYFYFLRPLSAFEEYNGQIFIATKKHIGENDALLLSLLLFRYLSEEVYYRNNQNAIKSAKAAIMSRNMSHNLGSHVMYYLKLKLGNVYNILTKDVLKKVINHDKTNGQLSCQFNKIGCNLISELDGMVNDQNQVDNKVSFPFLIGLGRFINYLQERMDFIATVSTDYIPYFMTVNFKDAVYDELNYDMKMLRHQGDTESFKGKMADNILLDNIVRSEGLIRENIILKFGTFEGNNPERYNIQNQDGIVTAHENPSLKELRDVNIDLPGGQTGRQAIFSIFENFIRNSAKHGGTAIRGKGGKLIVSMEVKEIIEFPELIKFTIWNNLGDIGIINKNEGENVEKLKKAIAEDYVNEMGIMIGTNKGIKEMKISAAWLRGVKDENTANPPILKARNKDGNIAYDFYLLKPQNVAIICNQTDEVIKNINIEIVKYGWKLFTSEEFLKETSRHKIIVIDAINNENNELLSKLLKVTHSRVIIEKLEDSFYINILEKYFRESQFIHFYNIHIVNILKISKNELRKIFIDDGVIPDKKFNNIIIEEGADYYKENRICFKKHFLSDADTFDSDKTHSTNDKVQYIESITGHNSTDRLIRKGSYDEYWYLQMNECALTRVAIFDERLWSDYSKISNDVIEGVFNNKPKNINELTQTKKDSITTKIQEIKKTNKLNEWFKLYDFIKQDIACQLKEDDSNSLSNICKSVITNYDLTKFFDEFNKLLNKVNLNAEHKLIISDAVNSLVLKKKNLSIFNVVQTEKGFVIIKHDFSEETALDDFKKESYKIVGVIKLNKSKQIEIIHNTDEKYHFISVHQGILDKLYEGFKIKNDNEKMVEVTNKLKVTYCYNNNHPKHINNLIIHSGRSRPDKADMPQEIPFIQYSSLENAVNDCKFSLTEVLYSAKYDNK